MDLPYDGEKGSSRVYIPWDIEEESSLKSTKVVPKAPKGGSPRI